MFSSQFFTRFFCVFVVVFLLLLIFPGHSQLAGYKDTDQICQPCCSDRPKFSTHNFRSALPHGGFIFFSFGFQVYLLFHPSHGTFLSLSLPRWSWESLIHSLVWTHVCCRHCCGYVWAHKARLLNSSYLSRGGIHCENLDGSHVFLSSSVPSCLLLIQLPRI